MRTTKFDQLISFDRISENKITQAKKFQAAILADVTGRRGGLPTRIQPLRNDMHLVGSAFTVEIRPGDNLMIHSALALAKPGDIIVVAGQGYEGSALFGELMVTQAIAAGLGGIVVDGACRDSHFLSKASIPVFAAGRNPAGPTRNIAGRLCGTISIGNVSISPGDLIVGDADGVVCIPANEVDDALVAAEKKVNAENQRLDEISKGVLMPTWLNDALRTAGILTNDETLL